MKRLLSLALLAVLTLPLMAQQKRQFTLEQLIYGGTEYWNYAPEYQQYGFWGDCLVRLDVEAAVMLQDEKGKPVEQTLFTADDLSAAGFGRALNIMAATFPDGAKPQALVYTTEGTMLYDWQTKQAVWTLPRVEGELEFCLASRSTAFERDHNLFVRTADGRDHQVSRDGSRELVYGKSVHRDEFGISKGTFWSPKGNLLAFYRMDQSMVTDYPQVNIALPNLEGKDGSRIAQLEPDKYPMAGETSHKVTVGIFDPATDRTVYLQAGDPTDRYFTNIAWSPDEATVYMIELPRTQDKAELVAYDARTGARLRVLYTETNPKYVHPVHPITFLPWDDTKFIYQSERDGYNHLYLFDVERGEQRQLTSGAFVVTDILGFNAKDKSVVIASHENSPVRTNFWTVSVKNGKRQMLDGGEGVHSGVLSQGGAFIADRWASPDVVRRYDVLNVTHPERLRTLHDCPDPWAGFEVPEITGGSIKAADGTTDLYYRLIKPTGFDPAKKYPAIVYVYGGPGVRNVEETRNWDARGWEIYMAQLGYVVFVLDNRGSSDRGFAFETATFRHLGDQEMADQMQGVAYLKSLPYVDADRLGVHGWSFGGFMTTNLMLTYPDVFKVGVAGGPVIDWRYYEVMYGERYMDTPQENPEGYEQSSLLRKAGNLKGRLQVIIGYNDPVCVPQHSLAFMRACEDAGTQPDFFLYPGDGHNMMGRDRVHLHERITRYFEDYLK
ncbi:MAG: DPP IV N-terminal domain-containing protein [Bacteroidaceae bacterium]|nr:DPP IV N-terminal domain-containing protein [Bacteroidaceae bacterium]